MARSRVAVKKDTKTFRITPTLFKRLAHLAVDEGKRVSDLVQEAIEQFLDNRQTRSDKNSKEMEEQLGPSGQKNVERH